MVIEDGLCAVDLRHLSEDEKTALRKQAIDAGIGLPELLARIVEDATRRLLENRAKSIAFPSQTAARETIAKAAGANPNESTESEEGDED